MTDINFGQVTVQGVAQSKEDRKKSDLTERAKKNQDYQALKASMEPPKPNKAEKALRKAYVDQATARLSGVPDASDPFQALEEAELERQSLIRKIASYYTLPRHKNRKQMSITSKTTTEELKAEIYDLENEQAQGAPELVFLCMAKVFGTLENLSAEGNNFTGLNLRGLKQNVAKNKDELMPIAQEIAIKYSDYWPKTGVWGRFLSAGFQLAMFTHNYNTDPEFKRLVDAAESAGANLSPEDEKRFKE